MERFDRHPQRLLACHTVRLSHLLTRMAWMPEVSPPPWPLLNPLAGEKMQGVEVRGNLNLEVA